MLKVGIVGLGGMGTVHYMNYKHIPQVKVVACVGTTDADKEKAKQWDLPIFDSIEAMGKEVDLDIVDICTPTFLHKDHVEQALNLNKNVICEKPLALKSEDAKYLFDLAKDKGKHLYVAQVVQFMKQTEILRQIINEGKYGKPLDAVFHRLSAKPNWGSGSWMFDKSKAGLIPYDLHIHDLDLIVSLFGAPDSVEIQETQGILDFPEHYRFLYNYDGLNVVGEAAWFNANIPFTAKWTVYFEKAFLVNDQNGLILYPSDGEAIIYDIEEENKIETGINVPPTEMYLNELKHFVACILEDIDSPIVTEKQVISTLEILETISQLN
ncbi:MAG: Gfo/Idh/MocA family oxidoreductase [Erysipelothrix sp.]|nr:Gfo/Idh/MocA family oxidoreductase [Erysipelothrix sp.]